VANPKPRRHSSTNLAVCSPLWTDLFPVLPFKFTNATTILANAFIA
jgi:hypothetical protein